MVAVIHYLTLCGEVIERMKALYSLEVILLATGRKLTNCTGLSSESQLPSTLLSEHSHSQASEPKHPNPQRILCLDDSKTATCGKAR